MKQKQIFSIFSNKKLKIIEKPKIIADYREKNSMVIAELISNGAEVEIKELKVADYIVKSVAIERKTVSDFLSSMINKRLIRQLEEIQQYKNRLLIIEGFEEQEMYNEDNTRFSQRQLEIAYPHQERKSKKTTGVFHGINGNSVRGFILSILLKYQVPIIFTKNPEDTAKFLLVIARKKENPEASLNAKKKSFNKKEQMQFILEGFPGIGPSTAKKLLVEFKTLKKIINASQEELKKVIGKKAEIFNIVEDKY